ncbi:MAG TPA: nicotinate-nucleotide adenylyltransferase [Roseibacterium sp.]|nr:nicotinate-nucleotide adenylyltransferase [Roseibacterium sp.]
MRHNLPFAVPGQVIGLFGGSFDPPHEGHVHVSREALKRFGLDRAWWLMSPGNPLKAHGPAPMELRMEAARALITHPRVEVTDIEAHLGTRYTAATLERLCTLYPGVRFVWLMGADNLAQFHRWQRWEWIMKNIPVGVLARPGQRISARTSVAAQRFRGAKIPATAAQLLGHAKAPAWCFLNVPMMDASSSEIRARGEWGGESG